MSTASAEELFRRTSSRQRGWPYLRNGKARWRTLGGKMVVSPRLCPQCTSARKARGEVLHHWFGTAYGLAMHQARVHARETGRE